MDHHINTDSDTIKPTHGNISQRVIDAAGRDPIKIEAR